jgi:hypothetical protein
MSVCYQIRRRIYMVYYSRENAVANVSIEVYGTYLAALAALTPVQFPGNKAFPGNYPVSQPG